MVTHKRLPRETAEAAQARRGSGGGRGARTCRCPRTTRSAAAAVGGVATTAPSPAAHAPRRPHPPSAAPPPTRTSTELPRGALRTPALSRLLWPLARLRARCRLRLPAAAAGCGAGYRRTPVHDSYGTIDSCDCYSMYNGDNRQEACTVETG